MSILEKIKMASIPETQYIKTETVKKQIYVHHTASSPDPYSVVNWWTSNSEKIATSFVIAGYAGPTAKWKDGDIIQTFSSKFWAWHLGLKASHLAKGGSLAKTNQYLNSTSIGIEICNWGQLEPSAQGYKTYTGRVVPDTEVVELPTPFRGYKYYQKYTQAQLDNTAELIRFLGERWSIPIAYKGDRIFDVCVDALQGAEGVWTHASVRPDKNDCHPQIKAMLGALYGSAAARNR
jgi:N-acetyl-anhydromuramyl-L-alanine amidase AmpD